MKKKVFIHIGYPKCFSTTLQRDYFNEHSEISFGGVGTFDNISYQNKEIEFIFESLLKYSHSNFWDIHKIKAKKNIEDFINSNENKKHVFSSEYLAMPISLQDIDSVEKIKRLKFLFKSFDLKIIFISRNPIDFIRSFYKEYIRLGYYQDYSEYIKHLITHKDRNYLYDLNYILKEEYLGKLFGKKNVFHFKFEELKKDPQNIINVSLSEILGVRNENIIIENQNASLTNSQYYELLNINNKYRRGIGISINEPFEKHRNKVLMDSSKIQYSNEEIFSEVIAKRNAISKIKIEKENIEDRIFRNGKKYELFIEEIINGFG